MGEPFLLSQIDTHKGYNGFGTRKISYNLMKTVGHETTVIGGARVSKTLFNNSSRIHYSHPGLKRLSEFSISLPEDPRTGRKLKANTSPHVWEHRRCSMKVQLLSLLFPQPNLWNRLNQ